MNATLAHIERLNEAHARLSAQARDGDCRS